MTLNFGSIKSIFPVTDENGEGLGADTKQSILMDVNTAYVPAKSESLNNACCILELQRAVTITPAPLSNMEVDIFSDASGFLDKIDTGNTTQEFSTDHYHNGDTTAPVTDTGPVIDDNFNRTTLMGYRFTANNDCILKSVTKAAFCDANTAILQDSNHKTLYSAAFGATATFNYPLKKDSVYFILAYSGGVVYVDTEKAAGFPLVRTNVTYTSGWDGTNLVNGGYNILNIITLPVNSAKIIQTNSITVPSGIKNFQLFSFKYVACGDIVADVSLDGGTHYQTNVPMDTIIMNSLISSSAIIKFKSTNCMMSSGFGLRYWGET
jgi:hypothetical protein